MEFLNYLANNVPLFSVCVIMLFIAFRNIRVRRTESTYFIAFTTILLFLSVVVEMEKYSQRVSNVVNGTIFTALGYVLRPTLLFIFILLANMDYKRSKRFYLICLIPLGVNLIVYSLALFRNVPALKTLVFYYVDNGDGTASFMRGTFLNFFSHAVSFFYLGILTYVSTMRFQGKHRRDGMVLIICIAIILITVVTEMLANRNDLLNIICGICMMINYIFILSVNSSRDPLTDLYDRRTYYEDVSRYKELINGVIQIDMNGLKHLNDNYGHLTGDNALKAIGNVLQGSINKNTMCAYRISGDEFLVLMYHGKREDLGKTVHSIKTLMEKTGYTVALGCYYSDKEESITFEEMMKKSEELMYADKAQYYLSSGRDRRKS